MIKNAEDIYELRDKIINKIKKAGKEKTEQTEETEKGEKFEDEDDEIDLNWMQGSKDELKN